MYLHEYQAKGLFAEYGLPVSQGYAVDTADEAVAAAEKIGGDRWVVKVQVHAGGRGKGTFKNGFQGGVHLVNTSEEAADGAGLARDGREVGVAFVGIPGGHEFSSLVLAILHADGKGW